MKYNFFWQKPRILILKKDFIWDSDEKKIIYFQSKDDYLIIKNNLWFFKKGFQWDGVTNFWCGPEDINNSGYPITWMATLIHDAGCKYWNEDKYFPCSRFKADWLFFKLLRNLDNKLFRYFLSYVYYVIVTLFTSYSYINRILQTLKKEKL